MLTPANIPARFTALHLYGQLSDVPNESFSPLDLEELMQEETGLDWREDALHSGHDDDSREILGTEIKELSIVCESKIREFPRAMRKDLALLVNMLKIEDVPHDWRLIRWEILNSCAIEDLDRGFALCTLAEKDELADKTDLQLMRSQLRFISVFAKELDELLSKRMAHWGKVLTDYVLAHDSGVNAESLRNMNWKDGLFPYGIGLRSLEWEPQVYGLKASGEMQEGLKVKMKELLLFESGLCAEKPEIFLDPLQREALQDAASDIEKVLYRRSDVPDIYHALLARCHFSTGHFSEAARRYEEILKANRGFKDLRPLLHNSLVISYRRAADLENTQNAQNNYLAEFPSNAKAWRELADIQAQNADFEAAYKSLCKACDLEPGLEQDIGIRIGLALGGIIESPENLLSRLRQYWNSDQPIISFLTEYWAAFARLSPKAGEEWVWGVSQTHFGAAQGRLRLAARRKGVTAFATAVEIELSTKVFLAFRESSAADPQLLDLAGEAAKDKKLEIFANFILGKSELGIGQMANILKYSQNPKDALPQEFKTWVEANYPKLLAVAGRLFDIAAFRNPALHRGISVETIDNVPVWCREVIDSLSPAANQEQHV